jgi:hypothetical protein
MDMESLSFVDNFSDHKTMAQFTISRLVVEFASHQQTSHESLRRFIPIYPDKTIGL